MIGSTQAVKTFADSTTTWSARGESYKIFKHGEEVQEFMDVAPLAKLTPFSPHG